MISKRTTPKAKQRKRRIPPLTGRRIELMKQLWPPSREFSAEHAQRLHQQLENDLRKLAKIYKVRWHPDGNRVGNAILRKYFTSLARTEAGVIARASAREKHVELFRSTFNVNLSTYWQDNLLGFDVLRFDQDVVQSGSHSMHEAIVSKFGSPAATMIDELVNGVREAA